MCFKIMQVFILIVVIILFVTFPLMANINIMTGYTYIHTCNCVFKVFPKLECPVSWVTTQAKPCVAIPQVIEDLNYIQNKFSSFGSLGFSNQLRTFPVLYVTI